jgi:superfamily II helicase
MLGSQGGLVNFLYLLDADTSPQQTEEVAQGLSEHGIMAAIYHAGMKDEERSDVQDRFMREENQTVILRADTTSWFVMAPLD